MKVSDKAKKIVAILWVLLFIIGVIVFFAVSNTAGGIILVALAAITVSGLIAFITFRRTLKRLEEQREEEKKESE